MSWSSRKKTAYLVTTFFVIFVIVGTIAFLKLYKPPTCLDDKQNQGEEGIDCGGPCTTVCGFEIIDPIIHWSRVAKMMDGSYSVTTLIENPNISAEAYSVPYIFKLYDDGGLLVSEYSGDTFIPANKTFPIFSGSINVGNRVPSKVIFEFTDTPHWLLGELSPELFVERIESFEKNGLPRVTAQIVNKNVKDVKDIEVTALLFDQEGNLINSSKTHLDSVRKNSSEEVVFTWPSAFDREVTKVEIFPIAKLR